MMRRHKEGAEIPNSTKVTKRAQMQPMMRVYLSFGMISFEELKRISSNYLKNRPANGNQEEISNNSNFERN
jgi:hypothetical protein